MKYYVSQEVRRDPIEDTPIAVLVSKSPIREWRGFHSGVEAQSPEEAVQHLVEIGHHSLANLPIRILGK